MPPAWPQLTPSPDTPGFGDRLDCKYKGTCHEAILREGYAYTGVNVQKVGVTGVQKLKQFGDRYAATSCRRPHKPCATRPPC